MSLVQGVGTCLAPQANGLPCGKQIADGEPIGTIVINPIVGGIVVHRHCADAYEARKREKEAVKLGKQAGPGGPIDPSSFQDALAYGSVPLVPEEKASKEETLEEGKVSEEVLKEVEQDCSPVQEDFRSGHTPPVDLSQVDPRLLWLLRVAGDEWGPLGVAKVAQAMVR